MLEVGAKQNVINLACLAHSIKVEFLNSLQRVGIEFSKTLAPGRRTDDRKGTLQAAAIDYVVFEDRPHLAGREITDGAGFGRYFAGAARTSCFLS
jgi:hypothetical protein